MTAPPASDARLRGEPVARSVFTGLPTRYDRLAYLLSLGQDRRWRRAVTDHAAAAGPRLVLDVATGPAGVALAVAARTGADVVGVDLNAPVPDESAILGFRHLLEKHELQWGKAEPGEPVSGKPGHPHHHGDDC